MKHLVVLAAVVAFCAASAIPHTIPKDNSHYVEGESRYIWMPRGDDDLELVDLHEPVNETFVDSVRNGAHNQYWLFTRQNPNVRQVLWINNVNSVRQSNYHPNRVTVVLVHGWTNCGNHAFNQVVRGAFLTAHDVNIIVVDWSRFAQGSYVNVSNGAPRVGIGIADFLLWLVRSSGGNLTNVHLIGFSIGAHIASYAGRTLHGMPARVTGLDPSGPLWRGRRERIHRNDARYVEVIHTEGQILGLMDPSGDVDFYPNGGIHPQPGCPAIRYTGCSHQRVHSLFSSSVMHPQRFLGRLCTNVAQANRNQCNGQRTLHMGNGATIKLGFGIYGLRTGGAWPY